MTQKLIALLLSVLFLPLPEAFAQTTPEQYRPSKYYYDTGRVDTAFEKNMSPGASEDLGAFSDRNLRLWGAFFDASDSRDPMAWSGKCSVYNRCNINSKGQWRKVEGELAQTASSFYEKKSDELYSNRDRLKRAAETASQDDPEFFGDYQERFDRANDAKNEADNARKADSEKYNDFVSKQKVTVGELEKSRDQLVKDSTDETDLLAALKKSQNIDDLLDDIEFTETAPVYDLDLDDIDVDYNYTTDENSPEGRNLKRYDQSIEATRRIVDRDDNEERVVDLELLKVAKFYGKMADSAYLQGDKAEGNSYLQWGLQGLDLIVGLTPGVSFLHDGYSILFGRNLITGEEIGEVERALLAGSLFVPSFLSGSAKGFIKLGSYLNKLGETGLAGRVTGLLKKLDKRATKLGGPQDCLLDYAGTVNLRDISAARDRIESNVTSGRSTPCPPGMATAMFESKFAQVAGSTPGRIRERLDILYKTEPGEYTPEMEELFNQNNYRQWSKALWLEDFAANVEMHHLIPREFQRAFKEKGVWVNDPRLIVPLLKDYHSKIHSGIPPGRYNDAVRLEVDNINNREETIDLIKRLMELYEMENQILGNGKVKF